MAASLCKIASKRKPISRASAILILIATSPLFHAKEIRKPLMVIQGENDARVIKPESDDIVEAVRKNGVPVEYLVFVDEGHGFTKKKNNMEANRKILEFLDKYLKGK